MKRARDFSEILLFRGVTDMRKQAYGLAQLVETKLGRPPFDGSLFLFCNRRKDILKAVYFDKAGFCLWCKRLDTGKFPWLKADEEISVQVSAEDFDLMIDGVDVFKRHEQANYTSLS